MAENQRLSDDNIPDEFYDKPLQALLHQTRHEISLHMNIILTSGNDWRMAAERIGLRTIEIENLRSKDSPMGSVILEAFRRNYSVGKFLEMLVRPPMERFDIINECGEIISRDVRNYRPLQVAEVTSETSPILTIGELNTGEKEYFDAFVSYHPEDYQFIQTLINKLEIEYGFKLCIRDRNLCIGISENTATAELIEKRCKRVILVLSQNYIHSDELKAILKWQMQFAQALAPVADRMHKLVPLIIDTGITVPPILLPYNASNYTRKATREWFWDRVEASMSAPTNNSGGYEGPGGKLGRKIEVRYRSCTNGPGDSGSIKSGRSKESRPRAITDPIELSTGASFEGRPKVQRSESEQPSSNYSFSGPSSIFYVPMPSRDTKKKKKYIWNKTDCAYTT